MYLMIKRTAWEPSSCAPSASSARDGGNFRQPQSEAEDRTIWPCRDHERRSSYHRRIFFEVPLWRSMSGSSVIATDPSCGVERAATPIASSPSKGISMHEILPPTLKHEDVSAPQY